MSGEGRGLVLRTGLCRWRRWRADGGGGGGHQCAGMTKRGSARLPGRGDAGRTELAERLLASQGKFAGDVLRATTPLLPGKGGTGAKKSGGET